MNNNFLETLSQKMHDTEKEIKAITKSIVNLEKVEKLDTQEIGNWEYRDRQSFELGDIAALAENIIMSGQAQPIIVVFSSETFIPVDNAKAKYVVIAGYRRWLACKQKNIKVDAIIRTLSFEQAIACLVAENEKEYLTVLFSHR